MCRAELAFCMLIEGVPCVYGFRRWIVCVKCPQKDSSEVAALHIFGIAYRITCTRLTRMQKISNERISEIT